MLKVSNLDRQKKDHFVLNSISFEVGPGEIYGLVGPNGSGKSTVLRCIAGLLKPDNGDVYLDGVPIFSAPWPKKPPIGYVPEHFDLPDKLSLAELVTFYGETRGYAGKECAKHVDRALEICGLSEKRNVDVGTLSADEKKFLALATAIVGKPKVLVLDEPATGMDPGHRQRYIRILQSLAENHISILLSSHMLSDLDQFCDSIGIISHGVLIRTGRSDKILLEADQENPIQILVLDHVDEAAALLRNQDQVVRLTMDENRIAVWFSGSREDESSLLRLLVEHQIPVVSYTRERKNLESLFFRITQEEN